MEVNVAWQEAALSMDMFEVSGKATSLLVERRVDEIAFCGDARILNLPV